MYETVVQDILKERRNVAAQGVMSVVGEWSHARAMEWVESVDLLSAAVVTQSIAEDLPSFDGSTLTFLMCNWTSNEAKKIRKTIGLSLVKLDRTKFAQCLAKLKKGAHVDGTPVIVDTRDAKQ
jgi:hypothetical protein